jgi:hypothetical protein
MPAFCPGCGASIDEAARFCASCGAAVQTGAIAPPGGPAPTAPAAASSEVANGVVKAFLAIALVIFALWFIAQSVAGRV